MGVLLGCVALGALLVQGVLSVRTGMSACQWVWCGFNGVVCFSSCNKVLLRNADVCIRLLAFVLHVHSYIGHIEPLVRPGSVAETQDSIPSEHVRTPLC